MNTPPIDLRSDTVTKPTRAMREAMAAAPVGDDVFGDDPTVNQLQERIAGLLGKEAALFVPSGTMSNQLGVRVHCGPGDEFLCEAGCHIYYYEQAGYAQLAGVAPRTVEGRDGILELNQLKDLVRPDDDHQPRTKLLCLENTHNRGGGRVLPHDGVVEICRWAHDEGLQTHLDGARLFNAAVATGIAATRLSEPFDTVSVCFSKGLGAPIGSALAGPRDVIRSAKRHRKLLGGGMRQAGIIAAGALYALDHHIDRLAEDHANAQRLAEMVKQIEGLRLQSSTIDTNIVFIQVEPALGTGQEVAAHLARRGLLLSVLGRQSMRAVTHLDVSAEQIDRAGEILREVIHACRGVDAPPRRDTRLV